MEKFIYVDTEEDRDAMIARGYTLLKSDPVGHIYIFINDGTAPFVLDGIKYTTGDILTF